MTACNSTNAACNRAILADSSTLSPRPASAARRALFAALPHRSRFLVHAGGGAVVGLFEFLQIQQRCAETDGRDAAGVLRGRANRVTVRRDSSRRRHCRHCPEQRRLAPRPVEADLFLVNRTAHLRPRRGADDVDVGRRRRGRAMTSAFPAASATTTPDAVPDLSRTTARASTAREEGRRRASSSVSTQCGTCAGDADLSSCGTCAPSRRLPSRRPARTALGHPRRRDYEGPRPARLRPGVEEERARPRKAGWHG